MSAATDSAAHTDDVADHHAGHHHHHHHHDPSHEHNHEGQENTTDPSHNDRNIAHWNKVAKTYNSQHTQQKFGDLINKATAFVLSNISFIGVDFLEPSSTSEDTTTTDDTAKTTTTTTMNQPPKSIRVLDYACGPGTITAMLAGRATEFIGIDITPNMVSEYNDRFSPSINPTEEPRIEPLNAHAYTANLFDPSGPPTNVSDPKFFNFDLVAVGFGFHHFENLPMVTERLVERVRPGGVLMILDFFSHDKEETISDESVNTIAHHGFTEGQVKGLFEGAGLVDVKVLPFPEEVLMMGRATRWPFMARGRKPLE